MRSGQQYDRCNSVKPKIQTVYQWNLKALEDCETNKITTSPNEIYGTGQIAKSISLAQTRGNSLVSHINEIL